MLLDLASHTRIVTERHCLKEEPGGRDSVLLLQVSEVRFAMLSPYDPLEARYHNAHKPHAGEKASALLTLHRLFPLSFT